MPESPKTKMPLLSNAKARVFLALGLILIVVAVITFVIHWQTKKAASEGTIAVSSGPKIYFFPSSS